MMYDFFLKTFLKLKRILKSKVKILTKVLLTTLLTAHFNRLFFKKLFMCVMHNSYIAHRREKNTRWLLVFGEYKNCENCPKCSRL